MGPILQTLIRRLNNHQLPAPDNAVHRSMHVFTFPNLNLSAEFLADHLFIAQVGYLRVAERPCLEAVPCQAERLEHHQEPATCSDPAALRSEGMGSSGESLQEEGRAYQLVGNQPDRQDQAGRAAGKACRQAASLKLQGRAYSEAWETEASRALGAFLGARLLHEVSELGR